MDKEEITDEMIDEISICLNKKAFDVELTDGERELLMLIEELKIKKAILKMIEMLEIIKL